MSFFQICMSTNYDSKISEEDDVSEINEEDDVSEVSDEDDVPKISEEMWLRDIFEADTE